MAAHHTLLASALPHTAKRPGSCRTCGRPYAPGDPLLIVDREPHHAACLEPPLPSQTPRPPAASTPRPPQAVPSTPRPPPAEALATSPEAAPEKNEKVLLRALRKGFQGKGDEELRVVLSTHEGHPFVSVRVWYRAGVEWRPTKKGLSVKRREIGAVIAALTEAASLLEAETDPPPKAEGGERLG